MSVPFLTTSRRVTTNVVVEVAASQVPPRMPHELKEYVSFDTWKSRMSLLTRLASQYCRPAFERAYLVAVMLLIFLVPISLIMTCFVILRVLVNAPGDFERQLWLARLASLAVMIVMWLLVIAPVIVWKYTGRARLTKLANQWTKTDALSACTYGASPVWKATAPGMFRSLVVLEIMVPTTIRSTFDSRGYLPPYISAGEDGLSTYANMKTAHLQWSKDFAGRIKYGELPIYTDKLTV